MAGNYRYRCLKQCYINGSIHGPAEKRKFVVVDKKYSKKDKPSYLELIEDEPAPEPEVEAEVPEVEPDPEPESEPAPSDDEVI